MEGLEGRKRENNVKVGEVKEMMERRLVWGLMGENRTSRKGQEDGRGKGGNMINKDQVLQICL